MYVMKKDGQHYVYVRNGRTYVSTLHIKGSSAIAVYMPNGTLLTNASVTVDGIPTTTDGNGKVYVSGDKGKKASLDIAYDGMYAGSAVVTYGEDTQVSLTEPYLLTVTAKGFAYSQYFTVTTTVGDTQYEGSISVRVPFGTSVTVKNTGDTYHSGSYVILDGTNTKKVTHTFTMIADHTVTFTDGTYYDPNAGT